jgi:hypothetical protein
MTIVNLKTQMNNMKNALLENVCKWVQYQIVDYDKKYLLPRILGTYIRNLDCS